MVKAVLVVVDVAASVRCVAHVDLVVVVAAAI